MRVFSKSLKESQAKERKEEKNILVSYKKHEADRRITQQGIHKPLSTTEGKAPEQGGGGRRGSAGSGHSGALTRPAKTQGLLCTCSGKTTTPTSARPRVCLEDRGHL